MLRSIPIGCKTRSFAILLAFVCILIFADQGICEEKISSDKYMQAVTRFADTVVKHGRDTYGDKITPLFVDGLHIETLKPPLWGLEKNQSYILCNYASQQGLMRTLDGLTALTGDTGYRQAAEDATRYVLKNLKSPNGLLFWGGHTAWDVIIDRPVGYGGGRVHELKNHRPYFELMWRVNKDATRELMETIWAGHVLDWPRLDYNRHCSMCREYPPKWDVKFKEDIDVPYPSWLHNCAFANVTPPLLQAGSMLYTLDNHEKALTWTRRLAYRWQQAEHPQTGLSGGKISNRTDDRAQAVLNHVHPNINEAKFASAGTRYSSIPLAQMRSGEALIAAGGKGAEIGKEFIEWASGDLKAFARYSYQPDKGVFISLLIDGTPIEWEQTREGYYFSKRTFMPRKPRGRILWAYATAYRLTKDPEHWKMVQNLCKDLELGECGEIKGPRKLAFDTTNNNYSIIYSMLELHKATEDDEFLKLACRVGDNLLKMQVPNGLFPREEAQYARTGDQVPLALLHLAAAIDGKQGLIPVPQTDAAYFSCEYNPDPSKEMKFGSNQRKSDGRLFYGR